MLEDIQLSAFFIFIVFFFIAPSNIEKMPTSIVLIWGIPYLLSIIFLVTVTIIRVMIYIWS